MRKKIASLNIHQCQLHGSCIQMIKLGARMRCE